ncbi:MAG: hypothetical protein AAFQ32_01465 [Pseudomonadota bacterium]
MTLKWQRGVPVDGSVYNAAYVDFDWTAGLRRRGIEAKTNPIRVSLGDNGRSATYSEAHHASETAPQNAAARIDGLKGTAPLVTDIYAEAPIGAAGDGAEPRPLIERESGAATAQTFAKGSVVMALIDSGIAFANARFCTPPQENSAVPVSRFSHLLLPTGTGAFRVLGSKQIATLMQSGLNPTTQDFHEANVYNHVSISQPSGRRNVRPLSLSAPHGTQVADLLAGADMADAVATRPMIGVDLPASAIIDTSGSIAAAYIPALIDEILALSLKMTDPDGTPLPVVINISLGFTAGPCDGTHPVERAIFDAVQGAQAAGRHVHVTLPAGNHAQARLHAELAAKDWNTDGLSSLTLRLPSDDATPNFVEAWLPEQPLQDFFEDPRETSVAMTIRLPDGRIAALDEVPRFEETWELWDGASHIASAYYLLHVMANGRVRPRLILALRPTIALGKTTYRTQPGDYAIWLEDLAGGTPQISMRVQRDDNIVGYRPRGRQAYFVEAGYIERDPSGRPLREDMGDSRITRSGTLSAMATLDPDAPLGEGYYVRDNIHVVAADVLGPNGRRRAIYTGQRSTENPVRKSALIGEGLAHYGVLASGTNSTSVFAMTGTSAAAPLYGRWLADRLGKPTGARPRPQRRSDPASIIPSEA